LTTLANGLADNRQAILRPNFGTGFADLLRCALHAFLVEPIDECLMVERGQRRGVRRVLGLKGMINILHPQYFRRRLMNRIPEAEAGRNTDEKDEHCGFVDGVVLFHSTLRP